MMKGISGRLLLREFPEIALQLWKGELCVNLPKFCVLNLQNI